MTGGERTLVLVAGSGRSGTSLIAGILQRLGLHVPQPEVPADATNPRGFAESRWVVDFHTALLLRARVQTSDARPAAWALTAEVALDEAVRRELRAWLTAQYAQADHLVVKDPRLTWFLPLWRRCAEDVGSAARYISMVRHPASVVASKERWYGGWQGEVGRAAGWVNQTLFTERATRASPRVFLRYDDLLEDWTRATARVGEVLDLAAVRDAPVAALRRAHEFVDPSLRRSQPDWGEMRSPRRCARWPIRPSSSPRASRATTPRSTRPRSPDSLTSCAGGTSRSTRKPRRSRAHRSPGGASLVGLPDPPGPSPCAWSGECRRATGTFCRCPGGCASRGFSA